MALGEEQGMLESFVDESRKRVRGVLPLVQALVLQPDQADLLPQAITSGFHLFQSIKRAGAFLGLVHLTPRPRPWGIFWIGSGLAFYR